MLRRCTRGIRLLTTISLLTLATTPLQAVVTREAPALLAGKTFHHPGLEIRNAFQQPSELPDRARQRALRDLAALGLGPDDGRLDRRSGRWGTLLPAWPLIPGSGHGNSLSWEAMGVAAPEGARALKDAIWDAFVELLRSRWPQLGIDVEQLGAAPRVTVHGQGELVQIHAPRSFHGLPVRDSTLSAVVRHGNLVLFGTHRWGAIETSTRPALQAAEALDRVRLHLAPSTVSGLWAEPHLALQPLAIGEAGTVPPGRGYAHRLVWVVHATVEGDLGHWEALVDAHSGELLAFVDTNRYASFREVVGGVLPSTNDGVPPGGVEQPGWPMPFAEVTTEPTAACGNGICEPFAGEGCLTCPADCAGQQGGRPADRFCCGDGEGDGAVGCGDPRCTGGGFHCSGTAGTGETFFADSGGNVLECLEGTVTTTLAGRFVRMSDACGPIQESTAAKTLDLGTSPGGDCQVAAGASAGNTRASRAGFYELNRIQETARGQLPANLWLGQQLVANENAQISCGAFWDGQELNFSRAGSGCSNTGEIAAVSDHEWGHGMDANDANGFISNPAEGIADVYAALRQNDSCIGRGFRTGVQCSGYGDPCLDCTGVRDLDWAQRQSQQPHDVAWIDANCGSGSSTPCGGTPHCESAAYSEAIWDLLSRDLPSLFGLDANTSLEAATRLTYLGAGPVGSWFQCTTPFGGCNAGGGYLNFLAADDDNGDLTDGTPHMSAIFAAFDRHGIACDSPVVTDSGCAGTPTTAPSVVATPLNRGAELTWGAVAGAASYRIFRTDGVAACDLGKQLVGETAGTVFVDGGLLNGREYGYLVLPMGPGDPCLGPASACTPVTPVGDGSSPCPACGDGLCSGAESPCSCPTDCGPPPASEVGLCSDAADNDCDGDADCADLTDCGPDPACQGSICGNGVCEPGEDCASCNADCPGRSGGKPADRFCCGNGSAEGPEGDGTLCDGNF